MYFQVEKMEKKNIKITNRTQFDKLVQFMQDNPDIGRGKPSYGSNKKALEERWEQFAVELNSLGPPSRTAKEWQRVWIHYKAKLKKKVVNRQNILATGGDPSEEIQLSSLEESVTQLIQITQQTTPTGHAFGLENVEPPPSPLPEADSLTAEATNIKPSTSRRRKTKSAPEKERLRLLKEQVRTQNELLKTMGKLKRTAHKNYKINKKLLQLETRKAEEKSELQQLRKKCQQLKIAKLQMEIGNL